MPEEDGLISAQLKQLGRRLKQWRRTHPRRTPLPEALWAAAVQVAEQEGIYRTARGLHLDYANLKRKVEASPRTSMVPAKTASTKRSITPTKRSITPIKTGTAPTAFVELLAGALPGDCLIELEGAGSRMRIQMKLTAPEMMNLIGDWRAATTDRRGQEQA